MSQAGMRRAVLAHVGVVDACAFVLVLGAITVFVVSDRVLVDYVCYFGVLIVNAVSAVIAVTSAPRGARVVPGLIAAGIGLAVLGDMLCKVLDAGGATIDVSPADSVRLASYVVLCAAMVIALVRRGGDRRGAVFLVIDGATVVAVSVLVCWPLAIGPMVTDSSAPMDVRLVWAAYPLLQAVLLALVLMVLIRPGTRPQIGLGVSLVIGCWLATNILYAHAPTASGLVAADVAWMATVVLTARTLWLWPAARPAAPAARSRHAWVPAVVIGVASLLVPPAVEVVSGLLGSRSHPVLLAVGSFVLIALSFVRTALLMRSEQHVLRELERARDKALAASRAKSMFVATMSHELRTPLTTVLACAEMLEDTPLDEHQSGLAHRIRRAGGLLQSLIEDILDFSRIEAGHLELASVPFDLHDLADELADACTVAAGDVGLGFELHVAHGVPRAVVGDPGRLMQVAGNLLDNAVKFTDHGRVRLDLRVPGGPVPGDTSQLVAVEVRVTDTGIGIPPERLASVFAAFEHVDGSTVRRHSGSGLGLAICRKLVLLMGGSIDVRSELGRGSEFVVTVPLILGERQLVGEDEGLGAVAPSAQSAQVA